MIQLTGQGDGIASVFEACAGEDGAFDLDRHLNWLGSIMRSAFDPTNWAGRRVLACMPAPLVTMTQLKLGPDEDATAAVQARVPDLGANPMVRTVDLGGPWRSGGGVRSVLCLAMPREAVLRYVGLLHEYKLDIAGVYTPASMLVRAFRHVHRREEDAERATMYVNLTTTGSIVAFGHGPTLMLARGITVSGPDPATASRVATTHTARPVQSPDGALLTAINRRTGVEAPSMPTLPEAVDAPAPEDLCDELRMCMRHHQSLFAETPIERIVFTGDGATASPVCRAIAQALHLPAQVGDPLARWQLLPGSDSVPGDDWNQELRPQWAIAAGLASTGLDEGATS